MPRHDNDYPIPLCCRGGVRYKAVSMKKFQFEFSSPNGTAPAEKECCYSYDLLNAIISLNNLPSLTVVLLSTEALDLQAILPMRCNVMRRVQNEKVKSCRHVPRYVCSYADVLVYLSIYTWRAFPASKHKQTSEHEDPSSPLTTTQHHHN